MTQFPLGEILLLTLIGITMVYIVARLVSHAYFKSKSEFLTNGSNPNQTKEGRKDHDVEKEHE